MTDKTHYIFNHILAYFRGIACTALVCWAAIRMDNPWVMLALLAVNGSYKHDFIYNEKKEKWCQKF